VNPDQFDQFRRNNCFKRSGGKCIDYIFGLKGKKSEVQAFRYPKDVWKVGQARSHCKKHKGISFEPAASKN
jgi:hypothetical protein